MVLFKPRAGIFPFFQPKTPLIFNGFKKRRLNRMCLLADKGFPYCEEVKAFVHGTIAMKQRCSCLVIKLWIPPPTVCHNRVHYMKVFMTSNESVRESARAN